MELIKSKFAQINTETRKVTLLSRAPSSNGFDTVLENVSIVIEDSNILTISGDKWQWGFFCHSVSLSKVNRNVVKRHLKFRYEGIKDFFKRIQQPYVKGWVRYEDNKPFNAKLSEWSLYYA
tara:strand:- start:696 stop:1058 length:363 start_codon:yes stop_codon:yes gene_type:complete